ncbi:MAG TPA: hypothetical protein VER34_01745, partial [Mycobacterium sp.]|nr:hypothetical protein [Mycobacterium sp.]
NNAFSSSGENARAAADEADKAIDSKDTEAKDSTQVPSGDEQAGEQKPVKPDHGTSDLPGKSINRVRYVPKRHLPTTWSRCPKRRSRLHSKLRRPPTCPPSFPPRQPAPTRWTRLRAKQHTVQAGMNHRC